jgi:very-long-chain enoyl-CoA reductase
MIATTTDYSLYFGFAVFLLGQGSNFYHHILLTRLRSNESREYKIPEGGLFSLVNCPHYLSEIIGWIGIAIMSKYLIVYGLTFIMSAYLFGRSINTTRWYREKIPNFPKDRKSILPFVL